MAPKPVSQTPVAAGGPETPAPSTTGVTQDWAQNQADVAEAADMLRKRGIDITPEKLNFIEQLQKMGQQIR